MKKIRKIKRGVGFTCLAMCIIMFLKNLNRNTIANYYSDKEDALPSVENPEFAPKRNNSLFFHETSYNGELTARKACAVEAAARAHPNSEVYVLFSAPVADYKLKTGCLAKLHLFPNVNFLRVHIAEYSKGTAVQSILLNSIKESRFPIQHTADILRILTLNKWGGTSLDSDMIIVKSLKDLPLNWIVKQGAKSVAPGIMSFDKDFIGKNITSSILEEIKKTYNPNDRYITGPKAIQKVIQRMCPIRIRWESCSDIAIFKYRWFYPIDKIIWNTEYKVTLDQVSYSFQWDFSRHRRNIFSFNAPKEKLARRYCPSIFATFRDKLLGD